MDSIIRRKKLVKLTVLKKSVAFIWLDDPHLTSAQDCITSRQGQFIQHIASLAPHSIYTHINLWKLALRGHLNTDAQGLMF